MSEEKITQGVHHIGFTVPDIAKTRDFFVDVLGFDQVGERPTYPAVFVSDGATMLTLWQATDPEKATPFDRKQNIGLHHVALQVISVEQLHILHQALGKAEGVTMEFAPEALGTSGIKHMMCTIPGGIRVEFIAAP